MIFQQLPTPARDAFAATRYSPTIQVTFCLDAPTRDRTVMLHVARSEHSPVASFFLPHNLSPQRVREGTAMVTAYLRGEAAEKLWTARQSRVIDTVLASLDIVDSFREIECDTRAVYVDRIPQAVVRRHPGDYAMLRLARQALQGSGGRISLAGGDYYGHSTVVGSIASGDGAARLIAGRYESCRRQISPQSLGWRASSMPRKPVSTDPS